MDEISIKIINILKAKKKDVEIPENTSVNLLDSGIIDSFDIVDLIGDIEEQFDIEVDGDDIIPENFESVDAIVRFISLKYCK